MAREPADASVRDDLAAFWLDRLEPGRFFSLSGKVAVVTGAAGGIGQWLSAGLAAAGAQVMLSDREAGPMEAIVGVLSGRGWSAAMMVADLEEDTAADYLVHGTVERFGRVDVLINNAGINRRMPMLEVSRDLLAHIWEVDYVRCYQLAQAAVKVMGDQEEGG